MRFYFKNIVLWMQNGTTRNISFENNKINVIRGNSSTGKSALFDIVDYCFLSSKSKISENIINENVSWYGVAFKLNGQDLVIARQRPIQKDGSKNLFFSSTGELPDKPSPNIALSALKKFLNEQFKLTSDVKMPFGGTVIKTDSKMSFRYFLLFNYLPTDIILSKHTFFDKQNEARYREALLRIFDIAVGIDTVENIVFKEKKKELDSDLDRLEKKMDIYNEKKTSFQSEITDLIVRAKEFGLINEDISDEQIALATLKEILNDVDNKVHQNMNKQYRELSDEILSYKRKIRNIKTFSIDYDRYKENMLKISDSLSPVEYISQRDDEVFKASIYNELITVLKNDLLKIKNSISSKTPLNIEVQELLNEYEKGLKKAQDNLQKLPKKSRLFKTEASKYIFMGQIKSKLDMFLSTKTETKNNIDIKKIEDEIKSLDEKITDVSEGKKNFVDALEDIIQGYMEEIDNALDNYKDYLPSFNYTKKALFLRKPKTTETFEENIGSSSNYMFLHLLFFCGLHSYLVQNEKSYVMPFLLIDQISSPYWNSTTKTLDISGKTDTEKLANALKLLDKFMQNILDSKKEFQVILLEHIEKKDFEDRDHFYLVEDFINNNALIRPENMLSTVDTSIK